MPVSVPAFVDVSVSEIVSGITEIKGELRYEDQALVFDYRTRNLLGKEVGEETLLLPLDQLQNVELKQQVPGLKILVHPRRLVTFEYVEGVSRNEIIFRVRYKHRKQAARLVDRVQQLLSEMGQEAINRIPFKLPDANFGMTEIKGFLSLHETLLELRVLSGIPGNTVKKQQVIRIEPRALEAIRLEQGVIQDLLFIRPKTRELFRALPGRYDDKEELQLKIGKQHHTAAADLVDAVQQLQES